MHRKTLATGIIVLFLISIISPLSGGWNVEETRYEDDSQDFIDYVHTSPEDIDGSDVRSNLDYVLASPDTITVNLDEPRYTIQYPHTEQNITPYLQQPSPQTVGPINSSWPMHSHDRKHSGQSPYNTSQNPGIEKWRIATEEVVCGPVIATDGTVYTQGGYEHLGDYLLAIHQNGSLKWRFKANGWMKFCTPAIAEDGTIYVGCWDHKLYAINPNGTLKWKTPLGGFGDGGITIGDNDIIYVGVGTPGYLVAIHPNGTLLWSYSISGGVFSAPAIDDNGILYCGSFNNNFYALYPNGTLKWKYKTGDVIKGPASIDTDGTIYVGSFDDNLYAFNPNGTVKWKTRLDAGTETNPSIGPDGTIYAGSDKLYAINPNGTIKWALPLGQYYSITQSSPAISADGIIYVGATYLETKGGDLIAVNPNGTLRWRKQIAYDWVWSSPAIAEDGTVYIGSHYEDEHGHGGYIHAFGEVTSNTPPGIPIISSQKTYPEPQKDEFYSVYTIDPDRNPIRLYIEWGDGTS
ncbi:MAG: PQQ-binding-like beta-propeller repeat protein, partial [Candidatus Thermoplasmatota archaeon]|nr:PQQ-binding-like beta-propeller repeat protein [Candidatus Thermoplasmatota archaeon]